MNRFRLNFVLPTLKFVGSLTFSLCMSNINSASREDKFCRFSQKRTMKNVYNTKYRFH